MSLTFAHYPCPLAFETLHQLVAASLDEQDENVIQQSLFDQYNTICSDVHILDLVLDPFVSHERYADMIPFLGDRSVLSVAQ